jgi:uncharacterized protein YcfL
MKKSFLILTIAMTIVFSACGSDRADNSDNDSVMNDTSTVDTAITNTDSSAMRKDTTNSSTGHIKTDSTIIEP